MVQSLDRECRVFTNRRYYTYRKIGPSLHHLAPGGRGKLGPKYAGPFLVIERVGEVAYRLRLPEDARIHDVFHVEVLKPFCGTPPTSEPVLPPLHHGRPLQRPERILRSELRRGVWHVLIEWSGMPVSEATWEPVPAFREAHPSF